MAAGRIARSLADAINYTEGARLYAVASRDIGRARKFAGEYGADKYYGDYAALCADPEVDVIYIASPMSLHYEQAKMCLQSGKNVLCEKTVTLDAGEFAELIDIAAERNVFFMEAMWMKFLPAFRKAKEWVAAGRIGNIKVVKADFSNLCMFDGEDRLFKNELGGGCLLDLGVYPITFACDFLGYEPCEIICNGYIGKSNVDVDASIILRYDGAYANIHAGFVMESENAAFVVGDKGRIRFGNWFFCTDSVSLYDDEGNLIESFSMPHPKNGYEFEVEEVDRCIAAGMKQSEINPLAHTMAVMRIMDKCRADMGMEFEKLPSDVS